MSKKAGAKGPGGPSTGSRNRHGFMGKKDIKPDKKHLPQPHPTSGVRDTVQGRSSSRTM